MWLSVHHFAEASWLQGAVPTQIGDHLRLLLVLAVWVASVLIGAVATVSYTHLDVYKRQPTPRSSRTAWST